MSIPHAPYKIIEKQTVNLLFIQYVNPKFTEGTGYQKSDVIGLKPNILKSGETNEDVYREMWSYEIPQSLYVSIDDFGTDCSSLIYLKQFPANSLMIDKRFMPDPGIFCLKLFYRRSRKIILKLCENRISLSSFVYFFWYMARKDFPSPP